MPPQKIIISADTADTTAATILSEYLNGLLACIQEISLQDVEDVAEIIYKACQSGNQVYVFGNGGSACTASHFARDLRIGTTVNHRKRVRSFCISDNAALLTSLANDIDYESVFVEQLAGQIDKNDVVIAISASGNSENVIKAIEYANDSQAVTVAFTGFGGGKLRTMVKKCIGFSSSDYGVVEDIHTSLTHIITYLVKSKISEENNSHTGTNN